MDSSLEITAFNQILRKETRGEFRRELREFFSKRFGGNVCPTEFEREFADSGSLKLCGDLFLFVNLQRFAGAEKWLQAFGPALESKWELLALREDHEGMTHQVVQALSKTLLMRDPDTSSHTRRVTVYCDLFCERLGLNPKERKEIVLAGLLHDLGKIGVSDRVLLKTSALSDSEWNEMRAHTEWGYEIVRCFPALTGVAEILRHHHERYDGGGYPNRLADSAIPYGSRIIAVADAFDAMTSDRPYRKALSAEKAKTLLLEMGGIQFDPEPVAVFEACFPRICEILATESAALPLPASILEAPFNFHESAVV